MLNDYYVWNKTSVLSNRPMISYILSRIWLLKNLDLTSSCSVFKIKYKSSLRKIIELYPRSQNYCIIKQILFFHKDTQLIIVYNTILRRSYGFFWPLRAHTYKYTKHSYIENNKNKYKERKKEITISKKHLTSHKVLFFPCCKYKI